MRREEIKRRLEKERKKRSERLQAKARQKADSEGPRTSWHSHLHQDLEQEMEFIQADIKRCEEVLRILREGKPSEERVGVGSIVTLSLESGKETAIMVPEGMGGALAGTMLISIVSPIGRAIRRKTEGETVQAETPGGILWIKVLEIV